MKNDLRYFVAALLIAVAACDRGAAARGDSLEARLTDEQALANQLGAQKDSLTRVMLDADAFIGQIDSAISTVKGLPRDKRAASDPIADQLLARKDMQERVKALVARTKQTSAALAALQKKALAAQKENEGLKQQVAERTAKIEADSQLIVDIGATIERQRVKIDSLETEMKTIGTRHYRAYYVIGTEKELMDKGVIVKEGGANLLIARPGRTTVPARLLNPEWFTAIDQREVKEIAVPDSTKRYRVVSRQTLDATDVQGRDGNSFMGNLKISKPDEFWAPSRFLILLKQ